MLLLDRTLAGGLICVLYILHRKPRLGAKGISPMSKVIISHFFHSRIAQIFRPAMAIPLRGDYILMGLENF